MAGKHNFELSMILKTYAFRTKKVLANNRVLQIARVDQEELQKASIAEFSSLKMSLRLQNGLERATSPKRMNPHHRPRKTNRPSYAAFAVTLWKMRMMSGR